MWYPTLSDVLEVYERIASYEGREAEVRDRSALDRAIIAPQRAGGDDPTTENLAKKAAALMIEIIRPRLFKPCTQRTGFALTSVFLDRNGATFQASLDGMGELFYQISDGSMGRKELAAWIESRLEMRHREQSARRILSALNHMARSLEELDGMPGIERHVDTLDNAGNAVCLEVASLYQLGGNGRQYVREGYPAVDERWGEAFDV